MFLYAFANFGAGMLFAFNSYVLPLFLSHFTKNAIIIGWLGNTRSFEGAIIQPVVRDASDRTWTGFGRRRPFMLIFLPLFALILLLTPAFTALPLIVLCIFLFTLLFNVAVDAYRALMAYITPDEQRNFVQGLSTAIEFVGQVLALVGISLLAGHSGGDIPTIAFAIIALIMTISFGVTVFGVKERRESVRVTE